MDEFFAGAGLRMDRYLVRGRNQRTEGLSGAAGHGNKILDWPEVFLAIGTK